MRTEKAYPYLGYQIKTEMTQAGGQVDLKIMGIKPCEGYCAAALGPATYTRGLDLPEGSYTLNFYYQYAVDRYHLVVKADSLQVVSTVPSFTQPEFSVFWRYPEKSFAYFCGTMTDTSWICDDFLSRLLQEVNLEKFTFPDYGEIPYPPSGDGNYYNAPARYFRYQSEVDFDRAGEILRNYSEDVISNYEGVSLWLLNWRNKYYMSWLFENR
jgi:hypothetical protein